MNKVIFSRYAAQELEEAVIYYELKIAGTGKKFKEEIEKAVYRIAEYPKAFSVERGSITKCLLHKFPFKILYSIEDGYIFIIALAHLHRKPTYWIDIHT